MTINITFSGTGTGLGTDWTAYQTTGTAGYISDLGHDRSSDTAVPAEAVKSCGNYYNTQTSATDYTFEMNYDAATGLDGVTYYTVKANCGTDGEGYYVSRNSSTWYYGGDGGTPAEQSGSTSGLGAGPLKLVRSGNSISCYIGTNLLGTMDVTGGMTGTRVAIEIYDGNATTKANWTSGSITGEVQSVQTVAPTSDISAGNWVRSSDGTGTGLYTMLDETTASDTDYVYVNSDSTMEVKFTAVSDPAVSTGHIVRYRIKGNGVANITVSLRQGASTEIASWSHNAASTTVTTHEQTLTGTQADNITDYADLRLRFVTFTP